MEELLLTNISGIEPKKEQVPGEKQFPEDKQVPEDNQVDPEKPDLPTKSSGTKTLEEAIRAVYSGIENTPRDHDLKKELLDAINNQDYMSAFSKVFSVLFMGQHSDLFAFKSIQERGFHSLSKAELDTIVSKLTINDCEELKNLIEESSKQTDLNKKLGLANLITQIKDSFADKEAKGKNKLSDIDLFEKTLKPGSIILMQQERKQVSIEKKLGDMGMITQSVDTMVDMTHSAVVISITPVMIRHATMESGVHDIPLAEYLKQFPRINVCALEPSDENVGNALVASTQKSLGQQYDKGAPTSQWLGGVSIPGSSLFAKNDQNKTNCVEYIADVLYGMDKTKYRALYEKSHPNDLLNATQGAFQISYFKTINSSMTSLV